MLTKSQLYPKLVVDNDPADRPNDGVALPARNAFPLKAVSGYILLLPKYHPLLDSDHISYVELLNDLTLFNLALRA